MSHTWKDTKEFKERYNEIYGWCHGWPTNSGKWWKRLLNKARRRAWKDLHQRGLAEKESIVNWRTW